MTFVQLLIYPKLTASVDETNSFNQFQIYSDEII